MAGLLLAYVAVWTLYAVVSKFGHGIHPDMGEIVAWSWSLEWGTPKHPPFLPVLVRLWFSVFPLTNWAYYLLAIILVTIAIYFSWLTAGFWLEGRKRAAVPFLLMTIPFYNFLAPRLDHNVILIPLWAITTYAFIRAYRTQSLVWSFVAGAAAGLSMLAKYWSFFLLLGFGLAVLLDRRRWEFFKSPMPWIMAATALVLFLPHMLWLNANDFQPFVYAQHRVQDSWAAFSWSMTKYVLGSIGYVVAPLVLVGLLATPSRAAIRDCFFPADPDRRFAAIIFWVPILIAIPFAIATKSRLSPLWTMSALSLLAVVLLSSPAIIFSRRALMAVAAVAVVLSAGALILSPAVSIGRWEESKAEDQSAYTRQLAADIQREWAAVSDTPLTLVSGAYTIVNPATFYIEGHPLPVAFFARVPARWANDDEISQFGTAAICAQQDEECLQRMNRVAAFHGLAKQATIVVDRSPTGLKIEPRTFVLDIIKPQKDFVRRPDTDFSTQKRRHPKGGGL